MASCSAYPIPVFRSSDDPWSRYSWHWALQASLILCRTFRVIQQSIIWMLTTLPAYDPIPSITPTTLAADVKIRFSSLSTGTHRAAVTHAAASSLIKTKVAIHCPRIHGFASLPDILQTIQSDPAKYHMGS